MTNELTPEQYRNFLLIELRIVNQRYVEILDELNKVNLPTNNRKLRAGLSGIYAMLDKETKKYDELFNATEQGTSVFYDVCVANTMNIMSGTLLDKNLINRCRVANQKNPNALEGILTKILKEK